MPLSNQDINLTATQEELSYWLAFARLPGIGLGFQKVKTLFEHCQSLQEAWQASAYQLQKLPGLNAAIIERFIACRKDIHPEALLAQLEEANVKAYHFYHPSYPTRLRQIHDPPLVLFLKGNLNLDDIGAAAAVVGTRRPTAYGRRFAKQIAYDLAQNGVTIISGMALGIDSLAHWGAIEAKGKTVAVAGCGVNYCYPSSNKLLYQSLTAGLNQAVVSEYFPQTKPDTWQFPARNRLIAGLSDAIVVIEAAEDSGALITAHIAFDQSRDVFAVPGRIDDPMSVGTNRLIASTKAQLCRNYKDVMDNMSWASSSGSTAVARVVELYGKEKEVFDQIVNEPIHFDHLLEKTGMATGELSATLTMLELAGLVSRLPGDWYTRETPVVTS